MLACVLSCAIRGLDGAVVHTEVDVTNGLPSFVVVGLPDTAVEESRERVQAAVKNAGLSFPHRRVTVNLAPASLRKEGPAYDLPIALGVLAASGQVPLAGLEGAMVVGELSLDGSVRHVRGVLPMVALARRQAIPRMYVPAVDSREAALVPDVEVIPIEDLAQLAAHLSGRLTIPALRTEPTLIEADLPPLTDFSEVRGQEHVKRALEVAAAGAHNVLMAGPPGAGKTLLARALPSILPRLTLDEALDVTRVYSVADMLPAEMPRAAAHTAAVPCSAPHHFARRAGGRRQLAAPGGDLTGPSRGALPGRTAGIRHAGLGGFAPAARRQGGNHLARPWHAHLSRPTSCWWLQ